MSTTTSITTTIADTTPVVTPGGVRVTEATQVNRPARVWTVGLASGAVAAAATSLTAVGAATLGEEIAVGGEQIPASGFATLTMIGAVLGIAIAELCRRVRRPRSAFVAVTMTLTALSIIPDVIADATWTSRLLLAATHLIAAAIVVPALARRLDG